ncbi:GntR family transcriptional regulator [Bdellovibrio sp. qaytius]|nr:GntR family transcriptional regulator [Bdellovibrio sp. qaytius]
MARSPILRNTEISLYTQVEGLIKNWISDGTLQFGSRIPSVRVMSKKLNVSISTVNQAYALLEAHGHIEAKPQSGYFVKKTSQVSTPAFKSKALSQPRFVKDSSRNLDIVSACSNEKLIPLGGAVIHTSLLPMASLQKSLLKVIRQNPEKAMRYSPLGGIPELQKEIAKRTFDAGFVTKTDNVIVTNGCTEALNLALKSCTSPGDIVAVESPTFHGILRLIEDQGLKLLELPARSDQGIDLEAFAEKAAKFKIKAALVTPNFLNPIGSLMSDENKERFVQLCYKHGITIIEDDIYGELYFTPTRPLTLKSFDKQDKNYLCSSFSKTLSAGYRIGWVIPPETEKEKLLLYKSTNTSSTNAALQMAIADHLANHSYERHLRKLRQTIEKNFSLITETIFKHFPQGIKITHPKGGCLIWIEFSQDTNTLDLFEKALKKNISVVPGCAFSTTGKYMNCLRINAGVLWSAEVEKALIEIGTLAKTC